MSVIALCSAHGSPGVTTTSMALAAAWPEERRCLLVEADPFGGVIGARYGLGATPGLSSLAAVARLGLDAESVWAHTQVLPGGTPVLVGPASASEAVVVLGAVTGALTAWSSSQGDVDLVVDCGRVWPAAPTVDLLKRADVSVVVARPSLDQLRPAGQALTTLKGLGVEALLLLMGDSPYGPREVAETLGVDVVGVVAWDPRTAAVLDGTRGAVRDLRRSPLVRSVSSLAVLLANALTGSGSGGAATVPEEARR